MENARAHYTAEEKTQIILSIMSKKTSIQQVSKEKNIAPTLISLWKKLALEAIEARFQPQPKGRRKAVPAEAPSPEPQIKALRKETRSAKIRASHLEKSLRETRAKLAEMEGKLQDMAGSLGMKMVRERKARKARKPRKA